MCGMSSSLVTSHYTGWAFGSCLARPGANGYSAKRAPRAARLDPLRRFFSHADAVRHTDAMIGVAREVQAGDGCEPRFELPDALAVAHRVLRHGARPAEDTREQRMRGDRSQLAQLFKNRRKHLVVRLGHRSFAVHTT